MNVDRIADARRWAALWNAAGLKGDVDACLGELVERYSQPQRHYHNLLHIRECFGEFDAVRHLAGDPVAVEFAIWFHDAFYDTYAPDNEERSAELAKGVILEVGGKIGLAKSVAALIMATKTHEAHLHPDAPLLVDIDLSILGKPRERFDEYEQQIRKEYHWVPEQVFASKRAEILERFLGRKRIYSTEPLFAKYEQQARVNLRDSIRQLRACN